MLLIDEEIKKLQSETKDRVRRLRSMEKLKLARVMYPYFGGQVYAEFFFEATEKYEVTEPPIKQSPVLVLYQHRGKCEDGGCGIDFCLELAVKRKIFDIGLEKYVNAYSVADNWLEKTNPDYCGGAYPTQSKNIIIPVELYHIRTLFRLRLKKK